MSIPGTRRSFAMADPISYVLLGKLLNFVGLYEAGKKGLFESQIEPLYQQMCEIHKDYIAGFMEVKRLLEDNQTPSSKVIQFLEDRRRDRAADRDASKKLAEELEKADRRIVFNSTWAAVKEFSRAVVKYFS